MAICMITLDHSSSGTYFWNRLGPNNSTTNGTEISEEVKIQTISQTQLMCQLVIYVGLSTFLSVVLQWSCTVRQAKAAEKVEADCQYNRTKVNALSDHVTNGQTRVIVENMDSLLSFIAEVKAGNDRCEALLNRWYRAYVGFQFGHAYFAYANAQSSRETILLQLLEGYRGPSNFTPNLSLPQRAIERRETLVY